MLLRVLLSMLTALHGLGSLREARAQEPQVYRGAGFALSVRNVRVVEVARQRVLLRFALLFENQTQNEFFIAFNPASLVVELERGQCRVSPSASTVTGIGRSTTASMRRDEVERWPVVSPAAIAPFSFEVSCGADAALGRAGLEFPMYAVRYDRESSNLVPRHVNVLFTDLRIEGGELRRW
jgi:hypothetical protein